MPVLQNKRVNLEDLEMEISSILTNNLSYQWEEPKNEHPVGQLVDKTLEIMRHDTVLKKKHIRQIFATAVYSTGDPEAAFPGVTPYILKMMDDGEVTVRNTHNDIPYIQVADVMANLRNWYMSPDDADMVKARISIHQPCI